jgi:hypothetical protein
LGPKKFKESAFGFSKNGRENKQKGIDYTQEYMEMKNNSVSKDKSTKEDDLRARTLEEAYRVLQNKGLLIWQSGKKEDYKYAKKLGFKTVMQQREGRLSSSGGVFLNKKNDWGGGHSIIFEKNLKIDNDNTK